MARKKAPPPTPAARRMVILVLGIFAAIFLTLAINSYTRKSATWDEPIHLTSGYAALVSHEYRVDPTHPPLLRLWSALPLMFIDGITLDTDAVVSASFPGWLQEAYAFSRRFLYVDNDADRLLYAARFMSVLWGVALGVLLFCWLNEWAGIVPAAIVLALYTLEPNIAAHSTLVTTDIGLTCLVFGTVYFLWRTARRPTAVTVTALSVCFALAMAAKFSAVILAAVVALLLVLAMRRRALTPRAAAGIAALLALCAFAAIWAAYGFHYRGADANGWTFPGLNEATARQPHLVAAANWVDAHHLLPNAFTQGFVYAQNSARALPAFLLGRHSSGGWWYYFPVAFLIKTPIAVLTLFLFGGAILLSRRHRMPAGTAGCLVVPMALYLGAAMFSGINIGLRHILPIYPFVLVIAGIGVKALLDRRGLARAVVAAVVVLAATEYASAYPSSLTFFNHFVGGPANGFRYLADSNLGWGQNLKTLKRWMDSHGVTHVNLAYFGQADPAYYGIDYTTLPGMSFGIEQVARPRLPGYVAISTTVLSGVYLAPPWRLFYTPFHERTPAAVIGNSIRVYWVDRWPTATVDASRTADIGLGRDLADFLLALQWPSEALPHYRGYLAARPDDAAAMVSAGLALAMVDRIPDALAMFQRAVAAQPDHADARLTLARALFGSGDLTGAAAHAERAVLLQPYDPAAIDLLGRVRAVQGRRAAAARLFERALQADPGYTDARDHLQYLRSSDVIAAARGR
jgi:hypothetical protein